MDIGFQNLSKTISCLISLEYLELDFSSKTYLTKESWKICSNSLATLLNLKQLHIYFKNLKSSNNIVTSFCQRIILLIKLEQLSVEFQSQELTDISLTNFDKVISKYQNLTSLYLNIFIHDIDLINLGCALEKIQKLQKLKLIFNRNNQLTDKSLIALGKGISNHKQLFKLYLDFEENEQFTDEGLSYFSVALSNLTNLSFLKLSFQCITRCTDIGFLILGNSLSLLLQLQKLALNFHSSKQFSNKALKSWEKSLKTLKELKKINLVMYGKCSDKEVYTFIKSFSFVAKSNFHFIKTGLFNQKDIKRLMQND